VDPRVTLNEGTFPKMNPKAMKEAEENKSRTIGHYVVGKLAIEIGVVNYMALMKQFLGEFLCEIWIKPKETHVETDVNFCVFACVYR